MKKNKIIIKYILTGAIVFGSVISCKKSFLDINQNPNDPSDVTIVELLPSAEIAIAHAVGNNLQIYGGIWGQYWTQSPSSSQYKTIEQYSPAADDFDRPWKILYADGLEDLSNMIAKASTQNKPNYVACAKILQAYAFQLLTDDFGDIPFSESLRAEELILSPKYDSQQSVYDGIIKLLSDADAMIDENSDVKPGTEDLLLGGDMTLWREFGNTLKLRVYLRLAYADAAKAQAGIAALEASGAVFLGAGEEVKITYTSNPGNTNPLYSSIIGLSSTQNLVASSTAVNYLINNSDPRLDVFYAPALNGSQVGIPQGDYTLPAGTQVSLPGAATGGDGGDPNSASAPVRLMTGYESMFLQAEAVSRGWMTGVAKTLYEAAINENFASFGVTDTFTNGFVNDTNVAFPTTGIFADELKAIITQKWIALCGNQGTEGWTEWRRTGYPDFFVESATSIIGAGRMPNRLFYPTAEVTRNGNFPGQSLIYNKVWWDKN